MWIYQNGEEQGASGLLIVAFTSQLQAFSNWIFFPDSQLFENRNTQKCHVNLIIPNKKKCTKTG